MQCRFFERRWLVTNRIVLLSAFVFALGVIASNAVACWDNSDRIILQLKKLNLNTEQLKDVFLYQKEHKDVVARAHKEGLGCRYHENHDAVFEKKAVGVLTGAQFKKHTGRGRTQVESLKYDNRLLKKEIAKLKEMIKKLQAELAKLKSAK